MLLIIILLHISDKAFVTPDLSIIAKESSLECDVESPVKRCLEVDLDNENDSSGEMLKKKKEEEDSGSD